MVVFECVETAHVGNGDVASREASRLYHILEVIRRGERPATLRPRPSHFAPRPAPAHCALRSRTGGSEGACAALAPHLAEQGGHLAAPRRAARKVQWCEPTPAAPAAAAAFAKSSPETIPTRCFPSMTRTWRARVAAA